MSVRPRVLIVDDDRDFRNALAASVKKYGYDPVVAPRAETALEILETHREIALVLADWLLPGLDGLELTRQIRELHDPPAVILVSARTRREDVLAAIEAGASDYVAKPVHLGRLLLKMNALVEKRRAANDTDPSAVPETSINARVAFTLTDISATGCRFDSAFALPRGAVVFLESPEVAARLRLEETQTFPVRVVKSEQAGKRWTVGAQFVGLDEEVTRKLRQACASPKGFQAPR